MIARCDAAGGLPRHGPGDVYYIRTDASDAAYVHKHGLVKVPRLAGLAGSDLVGRLFVHEDDGQLPILSTEPGHDDYTPAWQVHQLRWTGEPRELASVADVEAAEADGALEVDDTGVVVNLPVVKWSSGELPVDDERAAYLGPGQLLEPPDVEALTVTCKLHECFPASWYIVTDTDLQPMAEGMQVAHSPRLAGTSAADATGRTNVFMNGIEDPGPMGFQPSAFDSQAGDPRVEPLLGPHDLRVGRRRRPARAHHRTGHPRRPRRRRVGGVPRRPGHARQDLRRQLPGPGHRGQHLRRLAPGHPRLDSRRFWAASASASATARRRPAVGARPASRFLRSCTEAG